MPTEIPDNHLVTFEHACVAVSTVRAQNKKAVFTSGVFDILHIAHFHYLQYLRLQGDLLIVGVDNNECVRERKGSGHPFFDEYERAIMVSNIKCVDFVFLFDGIWSVQELRQLQPHYVGIPPFDPEKENKIEKAHLAGIEVVVTPPFLRSYSSSRIMDAIKRDS